MTLNVEQGGTIRLPADFFSGDIPFDPTDPRLHLFDPSNTEVATWLVPSRHQAGVYYFDFVVPPDAPVGSWTARWTGTINGEFVGGDDRFDVLQRTVAETVVAATSPAESHKRRSPRRTDAQFDPLSETLARLASSPNAQSTQGRARKWRRAIKGKATPTKAGQEQPTVVREERRGHRLRTGTLVALLVLIIGGGALYIRQAEKSAIQRSFDLADVAFRKGNFDEAQTHYFDVLDKDQGNKFAHFNLGILAERGNRPAEAQYYYGRALEEDPDFLPALYNMASLQEAAGKSSEAADTYRHLLKSSPGHAASHFNLGLLLYMKLGDPVEGKKQINEALKLNPGLTSKLDAKLAAEITPPNEPSP